MQDLAGSCERAVRAAVLLLLGAGALATAVWAASLELGLYGAIAELPQAVAVTCVVGGVSLYATSRTGALVRARMAAPAANRPSAATTAGLACVVLLLVISGALLANGVLYFVLGRDWPITPRRAGRVHFHALAGMVLAPIATALATSAGVAASRLRP